MVAKCLPVILWVLAWQTWSPISSISARDLSSPLMLTAPAAGPPAPHAQQHAAVDDYRIDIQDGVTVDSYNLERLAEHDAARTQSMIDGIAGRPAKRGAAAVDKVSRGPRADWLPRPATAALGLAGLMALVWMALRYRRW